MQSVWLGFLQPRSEAGKISRDAIGISLVRGQNASSFDRQIFINTQFVNELFNPPIRAVDDDGGKKRQKMDDGEVGEAAKQYSTSYAFSLVSPILIEIDRLINDAIAEDRKCPENTALLINTVIKRMEYGSDCNNAASLRAKMKKLECEQRDHSTIIRNIAGAVTDMRQKGNNSAMQKHVLQTLATAAADDGRCVSVLRRVLDLSRRVTEQGRGRRICFNNIANQAPDIHTPKNGMETGDDSDNDSEYDSDDEESDLGSDDGYSTNSDDDEGLMGDYMSDDDAEDMDIEEKVEEVVAIVDEQPTGRSRRKRPPRSLTCVFVSCASS